MLLVTLAVYLLSLSCIHMEGQCFHSVLCPVHEVAKNQTVPSPFSRVLLFATSWTVAHQVPLSMGFNEQEYWSVLPFPPLGDLPDSGIEPSSPSSPALADKLFTTRAT